MLPPPKQLLAAAVRAVRRMLREHFTGTAAELAYYGLLSTVPCIAAFVGILGLLGSDPETTEAIARIVREGVSTEAGDAAREAARHVLDRDGAAGAALGVGVVTTLWGLPSIWALSGGRRIECTERTRGPLGGSARFKWGSRSSGWSCSR
jgi:uncharacterized BrkB/YihY/UPF0761 family membrane protein